MGFVHVNKYLSSSIWKIRLFSLTFSCTPRGPNFGQKSIAKAKRKRIFFLNKLRSESEAITWSFSAKRSAANSFRFAIFRNKAKKAKISPCPEDVFIKFSYLIRLRFRNFSQFCEFEIVRISRNYRQVPLFRSFYFQRFRQKLRISGIFKEIEKYHRFCVDFSFISWR